MLTRWILAALQVFAGISKAQLVALVFAATAMARGIGF